MIIWKDKDNKIPFIYVLFYKLMKEKAESTLFISYKEVRDLFRRTIHNIPHVYYHFILQEMEEIKIIKKIGNDKSPKFEFLAKDLEKHLNKYNEILF